MDLILGCDTDAHHCRWGSKECNHCGFDNYLATTELEVVNQGCTPTFCAGNRMTVIDVTLALNAVMPKISHWRVLSEDTLSDHRKISCRNIKGTNWTTYNNELQTKVGLRLGPLCKHTSRY